MPKGSSLIRAENIRHHGAECTITDLNYDDAVRLAHRMAQTKGWVLLQDTARTGYEEIPTWIMQGYMTLAVEAYEQLAETNSPLPTHLILQAGVGSFAGSVMGYFVEKCRKISLILLWLSRIRPTVFINPQLWMMVNLTASLAIWRR